MYTLVSFFIRLAKLFCLINNEQFPFCSHLKVRLLWMSWNRPNGDNKQWFVYLTIELHILLEKPINWITFVWEEFARTVMKLSNCVPAINHALSHLHWFVWQMSVRRWGDSTAFSQYYLIDKLSSSVNRFTPYITQLFNTRSREIWFALQRFFVHFIAVNENILVWAREWLNWRAYSD